MTDKQKSKLVESHGVLCDASGDSEIDTTGMTNDEIKDKFPLLWACKELATLIGKAPRDRFKSNRVPDVQCGPETTAWERKRDSILRGGHQSIGPK